jgi:hypothetical protein
MAAGDHGGKNSEKSRREARLAAALRENLRRRKAQERGRDTADKDTPAGDPPVRPRESGNPRAAGR